MFLVMLSPRKPGLRLAASKATLAKPSGRRARKVLFLGLLGAAIFVFCAPRQVRHPKPQASAGTRLKARGTPYNHKRLSSSGPAIAHSVVAEATRDASALCRTQHGQQPCVSQAWSIWHEKARAVLNNSRKDTFSIRHWRPSRSAACTSQDRPAWFCVAVTVESM
jgi:hypothetical protein